MNNHFVAEKIEFVIIKDIEYLYIHVIILLSTFYFFSTVSNYILSKIECDANYYSLF